MRGMKQFAASVGNMANRMGARKICPLFLACGLACSPVCLYGDVGLPMLAFLWPWAWVLFLPIVVVEAYAARRRLSNSWRQALKLSFLANLCSTALGIPVTWLLLLAIALLGCPLIHIGVPEKIVVILLAPVALAWLPPSVEQHQWWIPFAALVLCIPFFFMSVYIEYLIATHVQKDELRSRLRSWSWLANLASYIPIILSLAIWLAWTSTRT